MPGNYPQGSRSETGRRFDNLCENLPVLTWGQETTEKMNIYFFLQERPWRLKASHALSERGREEIGKSQMR